MLYEVLGTTVVAGGALAWAYYKCRTAPEGYQDADGFHYGEQPVPVPALQDIPRAPTAPAIDWTKPLELSDGTPVVLSPQDVWDGANPDADGDYWVRREDGRPFENEEPFYGNIHACIDPEFVTRHGLIRNRAEPPAAANSNLPALTDDQVAVLLEMHEEIGNTAATLARWTGLPHRRVVNARRELADNGLAIFGPLYADGGESNRLAGRGYVLTPAGHDLKMKLLDAQVAA